MLGEAAAEPAEPSAEGGAAESAARLLEGPVAELERKLDGASSAAHADEAWLAYRQVTAAMSRLGLDSRIAETECHTDGPEAPHAASTDDVDDVVSHVTD